MKSLAELAAIREKMKDKVILREGTGEIRVVVGMATCGIAAGARPVLSALDEQRHRPGQVPHRRRPPCAVRLPGGG